MWGECAYIKQNLVVLEPARTSRDLTCFQDHFTISRFADDCIMEKGGGAGLRSAETFVGFCVCIYICIYCISTAGWHATRVCVNLCVCNILGDILNILGGILNILGDSQDHGRQNHGRQNNCTREVRRCKLHEIFKMEL